MNTINACDRRPKEETRRLGEAWFKNAIESQVKGCDPWDCVAIDILSGDFEVDKNVLTAIDRLRARRPNAEIWSRRVGFPYMHRIGFIPRRRPVTVRRIES
jgi:hypothetical protein